MSDMTHTESLMTDWWHSAQTGECTWGQLADWLHGAGRAMDRIHRDYAEDYFALSHVAAERHMMALDERAA